MSTPTPSADCPYRLDPAGQDIHGEAAALRALGPAARVLLPGDIPAWSVTDPELIRRLLTHPDISKDAHQHWPAYRNGEIPPDWPLRIWVDVRNALSAYGNEHTRLRRPLAAAFTARRVRALAPRIEEITHQLLDEIATTPAGAVVDLRARLAWRLPLLVVNAMLGVPTNMHDDFRDAIGDLFATDLSPQQATAAQTRVYGLIDTLIDHKHHQPDDDITSSLIQAHAREQLTGKELADSLVLLIGAGHETTVNLLDWSITNLLTHPHQLTLATHGQADWSQVVEEALRHQAPIASILLRFPTQTVTDTPTGLTFTPGEAIVINYAAAGRDPHLHDNAAQFDLTRTTHEHLAFGHGTHYCLGAELARLEGRIALHALFTRFPHLRLAVPAQQLTPLPSLITNGHQKLPVLLGTDYN